MVSVIDTLKVLDKGGWQDQISACLFTSMYSFFDGERDCLGMIHHITVDRNWYEISALTIASWFAAWFEPGVSALYKFFPCQSDWLRIARNFSLIIRNLLHQKCVTKKAKSFWFPISLFVSFFFFSYIFVKCLAILCKVIAVLFIYHSVIHYFSVFFPLYPHFTFFSAALAVMPLIIQLKRQS